MKRVILLFALCAIVGLSFGQKKPKIGQAEKARSEGNLAEAKTIIDEAIEHEKTKDDGKTWYYRGLIYASLDTTSNPEYQNLANNPLKIAMEAFGKALAIDPDGNKYYLTAANGLPLLMEQQIQTLWGHYLNKGVQNFQNEELAKAISDFEKTQLILPKDTTGYIYAGLAAQTSKQYDKAATNYYKLINELDYHTTDIYNALIYIESSINEDKEKALEIARKGKTKFEGNNDFAKTEISLLIEMEKVDEAKNELETAISKEPNNPDLYFTLGLMQEELKNKKASKEAYQKAIDLNGEYYNAIYNLAVLNYNEAVELIKERNNLGISSADQKKAKELNKVITEKLNVALPYWEKADSIKSNDRTTLETLQYIYNQLKMYDKMEAVSARLESL